MGEIVDSDEDINQQRTIEADDTVEDFIMKFNPPKNSVAKSPNRSPKNSNPQLVVMEPSQIEIKQTEDPPLEQSKPVTKRKSRIRSLNLPYRRMVMTMMASSKLSPLFRNRTRKKRMKTPGRVSGAAHATVM